MAHGQCVADTGSIFILDPNTGVFFSSHEMKLTLIKWVWPGVDRIECEGKMNAWLIVCKSANSNEKDRFDEQNTAQLAELHMSSSACHTGVSLVLCNY